MKDLLWKLYTEKEFKTTKWSGGTTTELAICPPDANYADRMFLWRLSSARVDLPHSEFTPLPDYDRIIAPLTGGLTMKAGAGETFHLEPMTLCAFDGAAATESWGECRDFNLMLRKGRARGSVQALQFSAGSGSLWTPPVLSGSPKEGAARPGRAVAFYGVSGTFALEYNGETYAVEAGELLYCADLADDALNGLRLHLYSETGASLMAAVMEEITL